MIYFFCSFWNGYTVIDLGFHRRQEFFDQLRISISPGDSLPGINYLGKGETRNTHSMLVEKMKKIT
jgi:hypothetical protein